MSNVTIYGRKTVPIPMKTLPPIYFLRHTINSSGEAKTRMTNQVTTEVFFTIIKSNVTCSKNIFRAYSVAMNLNNAYLNGTIDGFMFKKIGTVMSSLMAKFISNHKPSPTYTNPTKFQRNRKIPFTLQKLENAFELFRTSVTRSLT